MTLASFIASYTRSSKAKASVVFDHVVPASGARYQSFDTTVFHPKLQAYLAREGFRFYTHQAGALKCIYQGDNVVIATSTASGKSLCYVLPVVDALLKSGGMTSSLLVFPLKALAQDQCTKIQALLRAVGLPPSLAGVYDADATPDQKRAMRRDGKIIITNPYGLHQYLGNVGLWKPFFEHLAYIMFDEVHVYTGVFGSNIAFVMRRLQRASNAFARNPRWIFCSATIGNPHDHATILAGLQFHVVDDDGSAKSAKRVWFWNPMFVEVLGKRLSSHQDTRELFKALVANKFQVLCFTQSRKMAELQAMWAASALDVSGLGSKVMPYRAGYPAKARRLLERKLRDKELLGIAATSALELGIDVGTLDAVIISGFPGSITSFWQQGGRCGRSGSDALVVLVAGSDGLDQYYMNHPDEFMERAHEDAIVDLTNPYIVKGHLECAVKEIPVHEDDLYYFGPAAKAAIDALVKDGAVHQVAGRFFYSRDDFPAERVPLNAIPSEPYTVHDATGGRLRYLTSETENRVFSELHEGAIFLFMAETYKVRRLDLKRKEVVVVKEEVDYYTESLRDTSISPVVVTGDEFVHLLDPSFLAPVISFPRGTGLESLDLFFGDVLVTTRCTRYARFAIATGELLGFHDLDLPETSFYTKAMWFNVPRDVQLALDLAGKKVLGGAIHAVEHGMISLFPRHVLCSRWDIGGVSIDVDPLYKKPMIFIYDGFPGGIGLAERAKDEIHAMLSGTLDMIAACPCKADSGCPSCVQSPKCGNGNEPLSKNGALTLLRMVLPAVTSTCPSPSTAGPVPASPGRRSPATSDQEGS